MRANPLGDWRMSDVEAVCAAYGVACNPSPGGGSHHVLSHPSQPERLSIPARLPIKPVYIRKLVAFVDAVQRIKGA
jgi:hypothetical protein